MSYKFSMLEGGPRWVVVKADFPRSSAAHAYALDWFAEHGYKVLCDDVDEAFPDCHDIMVSRNGTLYQYAIDPA